MPATLGPLLPLELFLSSNSFLHLGTSFFIFTYKSLSLSLLNYFFHYAPIVQYV